ncbi:hypothetical protein ACLOJK_036152 [Asimina triloba]
MMNIQDQPSWGGGAVVHLQKGLLFGSASEDGLVKSQLHVFCGHGNSRDDALSLVPINEEKKPSPNSIFLETLGEIKNMALAPLQVRLPCTAPPSHHPFLPKSLNYSSPLPSPIRKTTTSHLLLCGSSRKPIISDSELASELAARVERRKEAMKKSRDLLFGDFCSYLGLGADDTRVRWRGAGQEERLDWIRGFVVEWGASFHPLSLKSVKEMVEECVGEGNPHPPQVSVSPFSGFERLKKVMRLS